MKKAGFFIKGALFGAFVGSALIMLFTPWSGEELKDKVSGFKSNFQREVQQAGTEKRQELEAQLAKLRSGNL